MDKRLITVLALLAGCGDDISASGDAAASDLSAAFDAAGADLSASTDLAGIDLGGTDFAGTIDLAGDGAVEPYTTPSFAAGIAYAAGDQPLDVALADANGDSLLDAFVAISTGFSVLRGDGTGQFGIPKTTTLGTASRSIVAFNATPDPYADVLEVVTPSGGGQIVSYLTGNGDFTFTSATQYYPCTGGCSSNAIPYTLGVGDVNGDAYQDVVVHLKPSGGGSTSNLVGALLGTSLGSFQVSALSPASSAGDEPNQIAFADFDGDHKTDLLLGSRVASTVLTGDGLGGFSNPRDILTVTPGTELLYAAVAADFSGDGHADALVAGSSARYLTGKGDGTFNAAVPVATGGWGLRAAVGDLNRDGRPDAVMPAANAKSIAVLTMQPSGSFVSTALASSGTPEAVALGDVNGDGRLDIVAIDLANVVVYLNTTP